MPRIGALLTQSVVPQSLRPAVQPPGMRQDLAGTDKSPVRGGVQHTGQQSAGQQSERRHGQDGWFHD
jgi:hypothetical protein